ncbi:MAG TPA: hypothetical protein VF532_06690 [Candidatus Angelobacter sp.]
MNAVRPLSKTDVCEALHSLNRAVETILDSLVVMESAGIDFPFLNGHRLVISELRRAVNQGVAVRYFDELLEPPIGRPLM